jgi:HEAT repeat protein
MSITMKDVRAHLDREEPEYQKALKELGPEAIPLLQELVKGKDVMLASKATYLASLIGGSKSADVLEAAAKSDEPVVRVAAASSIKNLPEALASKLTDRLLDDKDFGVRKITLNAVSASGSAALKAKIEKIAKTDPESLIREMATNSLKRMH